MINLIINKIKNLKFIDYSLEKEKKLQAYLKLLQIENKKYNLTSIKDEEQIWLKHFYDSLIPADYFDFNNLFVCDIGTGAGFPGIVIKIFFPKINLTLIESNNKKVKFLELVVNELNLTNVSIVNSRAEEYSIANNESQDVIISRAMAALDIILEVGTQALKIGGHFICMKSQFLEEEIKRLNKGELKLGLEWKFTQIFKDIDLGIRKNIFYVKNKKTNKMFPRNYSQIKNKPIGLINKI